MSRRNGLVTLERRSPRPHLLHFPEPLLVPCPLAPDQTSPSAGILKAIQESWGNLSFFSKIKNCTTDRQRGYIVLGSGWGCPASRSLVLSHLLGWDVVKSVTWPAVCLLCCSRAQSSLQAADTTSSTCWQELLQKVLIFFLDFPL